MVFLDYMHADLSLLSWSNGSTLTGVILLLQPYLDSSKVIFVIFLYYWNISGSIPCDLIVVMGTILLMFPYPKDREVIDDANYLLLPVLDHFGTLSSLLMSCWLYEYFGSHSSSFVTTKKCLLDCWHHSSLLVGNRLI